MGKPIDLGGSDLYVNSIVTGMTTAGKVQPGETTQITFTGSSILPKYEVFTDIQNQVAAASYAVSHPIFVNNNDGSTYRVAAVSAVFGTASTSGTLQVEVATGTQAVAAGTNQLTGTMSLSGTANTTVNGTIIASPTTISSGARVNLIFAGTVTNLLNCVVTVSLQRIS